MFSNFTLPQGNNDKIEGKLALEKKIFNLLTIKFDNSKQ